MDLRFRCGGNPKLLSIFRCEMCGEGLIDRSAHKRHVERHLRNEAKARETGDEDITGTHPHQCDDCTKSFQSEHQLKMHRKLHLKEEVRKSVPCDKCERKFESIGSLRNHQYSIHCLNKVTGLYECPRCPTEFTAKKEMVRHVRDEHSERGPKKKYQKRPRVNAVEMVICDICCMEISKSKQAKHFKEVHAGIGCFKCQTCEERFNTNCKLLKHITKEHVEPKSFSCSLCQLGFKSLVSLRQHETLVHNQDIQRKFTHATRKDSTGSGDSAFHTEKCKRIIVSVCHTCHLEFALTAMKHHFTANHPGIPPFRCPHCDEMHHTLNVFESHIVSHKDKPTFQCEHCLKEFLTLSECDHHGEVAHSQSIKDTEAEGEENGEKDSTHRNLKETFAKKMKFVCDLCSEMLQVGAVKFHFSRKHQGRSPYKCPKCSYRFNWKCHLENHTWLHEHKDRPQCEKCRKYFGKKASGNFPSAEQTVELSKLPFQCNSCPKRLSARYGSAELSRKLNSQSEESIDCQKCGRMFHRELNLKNHLRNYHREGATYSAANITGSPNQKYRVKCAIKRGRIPITTLTANKLKAQHKSKQKCVDPKKWLKDTDNELNLLT